MHTTVVSNFAKILGIRRLKISQVSRATGISRTTLTNLYYEKGDAISFSVLEKLCRYLECGIGDLLLLSENDDHTLVGGPHHAQ